MCKGNFDKSLTIILRKKLLQKITEVSSPADLSIKGLYWKKELQGVQGYWTGLLSVVFKTLYHQLPPRAFFLGG